MKDKLEALLRDGTEKIAQAASDISQGDLKMPPPSCSLARALICALVIENSPFLKYYIYIIQYLLFVMIIKKYN